MQILKLNIYLFSMILRAITFVTCDVRRSLDITCQLSHIIRVEKCISQYFRIPSVVGGYRNRISFYFTGYRGVWTVLLGLYVYYSFNITCARYYH